MVEKKLNLATLWNHKGVGDCDVQEVGVRCYVR